MFSAIAREIRPDDQPAPTKGDFALVCKNGKFSNKWVLIRFGCEADGSRDRVIQTGSVDLLSERLMQLRAAD